MMHHDTELEIGFLFICVSLKNGTSSTWLGHFINESCEKLVFSFLLV